MELTYEAPIITVIEGDYDLAKQKKFDVLRAEFASGVIDTIAGRVRMVRMLLALKEDDLWKDDPLITHLDQSTWRDYLLELISWCKERHPTIQLSLSTLTNYLTYYRNFVIGLGLPEEDVFGAQEQTRRNLLRMGKWGHGTGEVLCLRNGYDIDKMPIPEGGTLQDGMKVVAADALAQERFTPDFFQNYHAGDGQTKTTVNMVLQTNAAGYLLDVKGFVKKHDAEGNPLSSFRWSSVRDPLPLEIQDYLEEHGWTVETPE